MTPETLERLAREAEFTSDGAWFYADGPDGAIRPAALARFAALVRAQALEEAVSIKTFPQVAIFPAGMEFAAKAYQKGMDDYAAAIRALGETK